MIVILDIISKVAFAFSNLYKLKSPLLLGSTGGSALYFTQNVEKVFKIITGSHALQCFNN